MEAQDTLLKHETKRHALRKFLLVLGILIGYGSFVIWEYGLDDGLLITLLTWSFFVLCTPVADAGFILDFPVRLITDFRMLHSETVVWIIAAGANVFTLAQMPETYGSTKLLEIFYYILIDPWPYYSIILVCAVGTFLSVIFGDELIDVAKHKNRKKHEKHKSKYWIVVGIFGVLAIVLLYYKLLSDLGISF